MDFNSISPNYPNAILGWSFPRWLMPLHPIRGLNICMHWNLFLKLELFPSDSRSVLHCLNYYRICALVSDSTSSSIFSYFFKILLILIEHVILRIILVMFSLGWNYISIFWDYTLIYKHSECLHYLVYFSFKREKSFLFLITYSHWKFSLWGLITGILTLSLHLLVSYYYLTVPAPCLWL